MHSLLLLVGPCLVSVFAQYQPPLNLAVNIFFDEQKKSGAVQFTPAQSRPVLEAPAPEFQLPFPNLTHRDRMKLACEAILKSSPQMQPFLQHQIYVCQHMFKFGAEQMRGVAFRKMADEDDEYHGLFNITAEFCTEGRCVSFVADQASDVRSLKPESADTVTKINVTSGTIPKLFAGAVANMPSLENLTMNSLGVEIVEVKAFQDLPNLKYLFLRNNYLLTIDEGVFTPLTSLEELHLEHNAIISISPNTFAYMASLRVLGLSNNALDAYDEKWFQNNLHLSELRLDHNELKKISSNAFRTLNLKNNISIYLDKNQINTIEPDLFDPEGNNKIWTLNLNFNKLNCIEGDLKNFFVSSNVHLIGNPLSCDCLKKIITYTYYNDHPGISLSPLKDCNIGH